MSKERAAQAARDAAPIPRWHLVVLLIIVVVGLVRGFFWVSVTRVFNPIDEGAHYAYVESMARTLRPPVVGTDRLSVDALEIIKRVRISEWRSAPVPASADDPRWGPVRESYEGVQGPAYYALMALPYRATRPFGLLASVYGIRAASVLLSLLAVPLAYLLARELFPRYPDAWLGGPALLVLLQGFNGNLASISNDALVVPLSGAILLVVSRSRRLGLTVRNALAVGALVGLGVATKTNMIALVPLVGLAALGVAVVRRERWTTFARWAFLSGAAAVMAALPWIVWNLVQYGALSSADEVDLITGPSQPQFPFSFEGIRRHLVLASIGYWDFQLGARPLGRYMWTLLVIAAALLLVAVVVCLARRRIRQAAVFAWLGSTWFVTTATMLAVIYVVFGGHSSVVGRHIYPSLVAVVVLMSAAAFVVAGRWVGWAALLVLASVALTFEQPLVHAHIDGVYTVEGVLGRQVPVAEQSYGETAVTATTVRMSPPCPAATFALAFTGPAPASVRVVVAGAAVDVPRATELPGAVQGWAVFSLPSPTTDVFDIETGPVALSASVTDRDPQFSFVGLPGDPVARIYCDRDDPGAARFAQLFGPDHPSWMRYGAVRAWPVAWAWAARAALLALPAAFLYDRRRRLGRGVTGPR